MLCAEDKEISLVMSEVETEVWNTQVWVYFKIILKEIIQCSETLLKHDRCYKMLPDHEKRRKTY